jgi:hypothetical protein
MKKKLEQKKVGPSCEHIIFDFLLRRVKKHYLKNKKMLFLDTDLL